MRGRENIDYKGWVTFTDGHIEDIISGFRYGDGHIEVVTVTGNRYCYEKIFYDFVGGRDSCGIIVPRHQFSKLDEKGRWLITEDIESFKFDTNIGLED